MMLSQTFKTTLNADVGEGCDDALIMPYLDCANVACAAHAGDESVIRETLRLAKQYGVSVGAHPGYPDKANFGRHSLDMTTDDLATTLREQIHLLLDLAAEQAIKVVYVKPHGALNHDMLQKANVLKVICQVVSAIDSSLAIMIPTNANQVKQQRLAESYGLTLWWEVFADRAYEPSGLLRPRKFADAVHAEPQMIIEQLNSIREQGKITAIDGTLLDVSMAQSICIHGDHAPSVRAIQTWAKA